jgi:uncharacterized protein YggE
LKTAHHESGGAKKASVLAEASGVKLGNIPSIDYSWGEVDFVSRPLNEMSDEDMREWLMCWHEYNPLPDI